MTMFVHVILLELGLIMMIFLQGNKPHNTKNMEEDVMIYLFVMLMTTVEMELIIIQKREVKTVYVLLILLVQS
jgi:hypothetical protein